jgi:hypothetical protein
MRLLVKRLATPLGMAAAVACGESTGVQLADLAGTWNITTMEFSEVGGSARVDLISDFGGTATIEIESDGSFTLTITVQGVPETDTGTITVNGDEVTLATATDASQGTISRNGDTVTIDFDAGVEFDFDDDGTDDAATLRIVMVRQ